MNGLQMPNMVKLGLGNIREMKGISKVEKPLGYYTKMQEKSTGKDTMTGHWEIMGLYIDTPFQVFPEGFPKKLLDELEEKQAVKLSVISQLLELRFLMNLVKSKWKQAL